MRSAFLAVVLAGTPVRSPSGRATCSVRAEAPNAVSGCAAPPPKVTPAQPWLVHSGSARDPGEVEQRAPIMVDFGRVVSGLRLSSRGALRCSKDLGRIIAYRGGREVANAANVLSKPEDCGEDSVTYGVSSALPASLEADCIAIVGVEPWTFDVHGQPGRARLSYRLEYEVSSGPPRTGGCVREPDVSSRWESTLERFALAEAFAPPAER